MAASNQADLPALDELRLLVVLDNEIDSLSSVDDGVPQLPEFGRTVPRVPTTRTWEGHECKTAFELCCACHGFSVLVTGRRGDEEHTMLFDVGPFHHVWLDNARRLGAGWRRVLNGGSRLMKPNGRGHRRLTGERVGYPTASPGSYPEGKARASGAAPPQPSALRLK